MACRNRRGQSIATESEVHMMETDIMRFLAMIALCLAIVFAIASGERNIEKDVVDEKTSVKQDEKIIKPNLVAAINSKFSVKKNEAIIKKVKPAKKKAENKKKHTPPKKGFQLSFKSDAVFTQLIQQQKIQLFKFNKKGTYLWQHAWLKVEQPLKYYQLHRDTLPSLYQNHLQKSEKVAVILPKDTERQLQQFVAKHDSGLLIIDDKANVLRRPIP